MDHLYVFPQCMNFYLKIFRVFLGISLNCIGNPAIFNDCYLLHVFNLLIHVDVVTLTIS